MRALSIFGTDFSMIALMLKGRTRSMIINKFHQEERQNAEQVESAIKLHTSGKSRITNRYKHLLDNAKAEAEVGYRRERLDSANSLDSTDQTIYRELKSCLISSFRQQSFGGDSALDDSPFQADP